MIYHRFHISATLLLVTLILGATSMVAQETKDTISIISFNDFHGKFVPDNGVPGAACLVGAVKKIQHTRPNPIVVCGGDNFSGDIFSKYTRADLLKQMFSAMKVEVSAIGNHEFDWGLPFLKDTMAVTVPLIGANIVDDSLSKAHPWLAPYYIVERTLRDGRAFRIAFIGLTTTTTPLKSKASNMRGLHFVDPVNAVQRQLERLRKEARIDMVIILMHSGISMDYPYRIEDKDVEMLPFVPGISAIIAAHAHTLAYDKINNIPVIQAEAYTAGVNVLYFQVRNHGGIRDVSYIGMDTLKTKNFAPDEAMKAAVDKEAQKYGFNDKLTYSKDFMEHSADVNPHEYTAPGAYVSASYAYAYHKKHPEVSCPIIGVNHYGGIRSVFEKGPVTYLHALNMLPFVGKVVAYRFTGSMLKKLLTDGRCRLPYYMQTSDITIHLNKQNGVDGVWYHGKEIGATDECIVVLDNYVADGSDGYDASLFSHPLDMVGATAGLFTDYLRTLPDVSLKKAPLPIIKKN